MSFAEGEDDCIIAADRFDSEGYWACYMVGGYEGKELSVVVDGFVEGFESTS
ncbi:hypothetical protein AWENTII_006828 [Aspergillus wentii]